MGVRLVRTNNRQLFLRRYYASQSTRARADALRKWAENVTKSERHTHEHISSNKVLDLFCTLPTRAKNIENTYRSYQKGAGSPSSSVFASSLPLTSNGATLLPSHSLAFFHTHAPEGLLAGDQTETDFGPPEESGFTRRMWAGGRFRWSRDGLEVGRDACASARVVKVDAKRFSLSDSNSEVNETSHEAVKGVPAAPAASTAPMVFVHQNIDYRHVDDTRVLFSEERVHVYLPIGEKGGRNIARPVKGIPTSSDFSLSWTPSQTTLFRFSALTFNAHLIHLDREHTKTHEGLPDLLVHGPLTAIMMMENYLVNSRSDGKVPVSFAYRARNPMFVDRQQHLHGKYDNDGRNVLVWAVDDDGVVGMTGVIGFMS